MREKIKIFLRFLRRLTVFDWLIAFVVLAGLIFLSLFVFKQEKWLRVEVKITQPEWWWESNPPPYWLAEGIRKGDKQYDSLGKVTAEVLDVKSWGTERKITYLTLTLRTEVDNRQRKLKFEHRPLEVGRQISLDLENIGFEGVVTFVEGTPDDRVWEDKVVEVRLLNYSDVFPETLGVMPWVVEAVNIGDEMRDTQDTIVAEVLDKQVKPAEKIVQTSDGRVLVKDDPIKKDLFLTLRLKTFKQSGVNYFLGDISVKTGSDIFLSLPGIDIWPTITKIIE